eukprot:CAMPEP_0184394710 /NCGR_PEP_ID=MMETSP0007-20130409/40605_1 /TAXON_ID=97485 /ORGANISM="Prymnesium parvum, Strain Texoma1" /LENGTH=159 /DNA_ID=CAMNT_0026746409 /DNA_START=268 /DNA_END=743 /DNA_ORIENTATION=-
MHSREERCIHVKSDAFKGRVRKSDTFTGGVMRSRELIRVPRSPSARRPLGLLWLEGVGRELELGVPRACEHHRVQRCFVLQPRRHQPLDRTPRRVRIARAQRLPRVDPLPDRLAPRLLRAALARPLQLELTAGHDGSLGGRGVARAGVGLVAAALLLFA